MERLTENVLGNIQLKACGNDFCKETCAEHDEEKSCKNCPIQKAFEKLAEYEDLEEQGKLLKLPCEVGDFALFSDGDIRPVTYITVSNARDGIVVGCQNGINISMNLQYGSWCKGFFKTRPEAERALTEMEGKNG